MARSRTTALAVLLGVCLLPLPAGCGDDSGSSPADTGVDAGRPDDLGTPEGDGDVDGGADADAAADADVDMGPRVIVVDETREACADRNPLKNAYFGDLHVHTSFSFDARVFDVRATPADAYAFARGEDLAVPPYAEDGSPARRIRLARPLDFAAVTDHSEFYAETALCHDPDAPEFDSPTCVDYRMSSPVELDFRELTLSVGLARPSRTRLCRIERERCDEVSLDAWQRTQEAAEAAYDRTSACSFTSFVAYEWSASPGGSNLHRNVIFRTATVPRTPTSYVAAFSPPALWSALERDCIDTGTPCDVIAIPHNSNLARGEMFDPVTAGMLPYTREDAERRAAREPLVEITQHKGTSECLPPSLDPFSEDERCSFEQLLTDRCTGAEDDPPFCIPSCADSRPIGIGGCYWPGDFVRGGLRRGLEELVRTGANPFHFGLVGSTDTHKANPGDVDERAWAGHIGYFDTDPAERLTFITERLPLDRLSPGGLAVVWAEENSRESIFDALRRRETYATSGPRMIVRFFGGWGFDASLCADAALVETGYRDGVPMGSDLPERPAGAGAPTLVVSALADSMGAGLAGLQVIKGWVDETGGTRERVYDVATAAEPGALDLATCAASGGATSLCATWTDPDFDAERPAFYYVRALEVPTCRWSQHVCVELGVDCASLPAGDPLQVCCIDAFPPRSLEERAWTSPIWYAPPAP